MGGDGAEVRAVLPAARLVLHQAHVRLVDERGRLQRLTGALAAEVARREPTQLLVDDRQQRVDRLPIPIHHVIRLIVTLFITTGLIGRSCLPVATEPIFFTTSSPSTTSPKMECLLSRCGVGPRVMKN